jgi:hypothetical protein
MKYKIGIGILLPDHNFNVIRKHELIIAEHLDTTLGIAQPPHITIKRPIELATVEALEAMLSKLRKLKLGHIEPITYSEIDTFPAGVLFLRAESSESLKRIHQKLLEFCTEFSKEKDPYEGSDMVFHTTLGISLTEAQLRAIRPSLDNLPNEISAFIPTQIGVFMWLPSNDSWVVIEKIAL